RNDQDQKENPSFTALFAKRAPAFARGRIAVTFVVQRHRNVQATAPLACPHQQFLALPFSHFLGHARRFRDHPLEFFHLVAQLRFLTRQFLLGLIERGGRPRRTTKHATSPTR